VAEAQRLDVEKVDYGPEMARSQVVVLQIERPKLAFYALEGVYEGFVLDRIEIYQINRRKS